jgi:oxygen-independent coproporphyrinogen-3 oxidase
MIPSLYIHIPVCVRKCAYCDFFSVPARDFPSARENGSGGMEPLVEALGKEIAFRKKEFGVEKWKTAYIGGGTPSLLSPEELYGLAAPVSADGDSFEFTVEANPEDISAEWLEAGASAGINRLSIGIQSMDDTSLQAVKRRGSAESNRRALDLVAKFWKGRLSVDLISGLPGQSAGRLARDIEELASSGADHVSLYSLTIEEGTPLEAMLREPENLPRVPGDDEAADLWLLGRDLLEAKGFSQYEVSNFARRGAESRHNMTYWNMETYIGAGPGATGTIITADTAERRVNTTDIAAWLERPESSFEVEFISREDSIKESILMGMRTLSGIRRVPFRARFGVDIADLIPSAIASWRGRGLLSIGDESLALTREGLLFLNRFLSDCLDEL